MKKNKDGFVEFPTTQEKEIQPNTDNTEVKADIEQKQHKKRKVEIKKKNTEQKQPKEMVIPEEDVNPLYAEQETEVLTLGNKRTLKLRNWIGSLLEFPFEQDVATIAYGCIHCIRKLVFKQFDIYSPSYDNSPSYEYYLVIDEHFLEHYFENPRIFRALAEVLTSDICSVEWIDCDGIYHVDGYKYTHKSIYVCSMIEMLDLGFFISNSFEIEGRLENAPWFTFQTRKHKKYLETFLRSIETANQDISSIVHNMYSEYPNGSSLRLTVGEIIDKFESVREIIRSAPCAPEDIFETVLMAEALAVDWDTPEMMIPKKTDWVFPWTRVDEDGFPIRGSKK